MSTNAQPSPEVKPAITEADVVAFLVSKQAKIRKAIKDLAGLSSYMSFTAQPDQSKPFRIYSFRSGGDLKDIVGEGETVEAAIADFLANHAAAQPSPEKLRAEAAAKIAEAEKLEAATAGKETA